VISAGLVLHFLLELCALAAFVSWGFHTGNGWFMKTLLGVGVPLVVAIAWGVFRVPNDPGKAPVPVPGLVRLVFELLVFIFAIVGLAATGYTTLALALGGAVIIDYALMHERIARLLKQG
jgi:Protein of unknown function (DUF2568)